MSKDISNVEHKSDKKQLDSSKNDSSWGGKREGAGRPKGSMNEDTKFRSRVKAAYQRRVAENADRLFTSQFNLAVGEQYLMCRRKVGSGASARTVTEIVTDTMIIKDYINGDLDADKNEWYFISTKPANHIAIDAMLDRAFGKAEANVKLEADVTTDSHYAALTTEELRKLAAKER